VVVDEDCAYSTQKQALNALAHFFKYVLGVKEPVFGVKLRDTGTRVPVVLSKPETQKLFGELREREQKEVRYELAARLQYGAGLRLVGGWRLAVGGSGRCRPWSCRGGDSENRGGGEWRLRTTWRSV
jgi:site-specific recombinase XerD